MTGTHDTTLDVSGLVEAGLLDLDAVFEGAEWDRVEHIATYVSCCYGAEGDEPGEVQVSLERATAYGIVGWRWREHDAGEDLESGPVTLDRAEAVEAGEDYAEESDETPGLDSLIDEIIETGYLAASREEIRAICAAASSHSQGYLLLPRGELPHPIDVAWTTSGYLDLPEDQWITLAATHDREEIAADALLRAIRAVEGGAA